jgi:uncharacterized membrane protein
MARTIKYAATHFSIAFSMSYAVNQNVALSALVGVAEPIAFAFGRDATRQARQTRQASKDLPLASAA